MSDENAVTQSAVPAKSIHQRNKSTPALSTLMNVGAVRGGLGGKRAALADVGNTTRQTHAVKDDSAINGKKAEDKAPISHVIEMPVKNNITVLAKPAYRPLVTNAVNTVTVPTKLGASETIPQPLPERRLSLKRSNAVLKDGLITTAEVGAIGKSFKAEDILAHLKGGIAAPHPTAIDGVLLPNGHITRSETIIPVPVTGAVQPLHRPALPFLPAQQHILPASQVDQGILQALEHQAHVIENATKHVQLPETQEYYLDEEDEDLYYEEGYTTGRSLKMRGDTTGGATIVLQPRYTAKVQAEIAAAKELVEASRTEEDIEDEQWDTSMVAEYGDEIFEYMRTLEVSRHLIFCPTTC